MKDEIIKLYLEGKSIRQIEKYVPIKRTRIGFILKEANIPRKSCGNPYKLRRYNLNQNYFECIDTNEKAYWLGFIIADGHVSDDGVVITLKESDREHLSNFLKCIDSNSNIHYIAKTKSYSISVYSRDLVKSLRDLGLDANKSYNAKVPPIKQKFIKAFLRGLFDGDGSLAVSKNIYKKGKHPTYMVSICGTYSLVNKMVETVSKDLNFKNKVKLSQKTDTFFVASWGGNPQVYKILSWLYEDTSYPYLQRKYDRYITLKIIMDNGGSGYRLSSR